MSYNAYHYPGTGQQPAYYSQPPKPKKDDGRKAVVISSVVTGVILTLFLGGVFLFQMGKATVGAVFGQCSTTVAVASTIVDTATDYELVALDYDCNRNEVASVTSDTAEVWLTTDTTYDNSEDMLADLSAVYQDHNWVPKSDNALTQDGYSLELQPHSYAPSLIHVTVTRTDLNSQNSWDSLKVDNRYQAKTISPEDIQRFALLPDYTPTYVPEGHKGWTGYGILTEYELRSTPEAAEGYVPIIRVSLGSVSDHWGCTDDKYTCTSQGTLSNGLELFQITEERRDAPQYLAEHNGHLFYYQEGSLVSKESTGVEKKHLDEEEIHAIFASIDLDAQAPAKSD